MHHVTYHTSVYWVPPSPLGLLGSRWAIEHRCSLCRRAVPTDQLISHAIDHRQGATLTTTPTNGGLC